VRDHRSVCGLPQVRGVPRDHHRRAGRLSRQPGGRNGRRPARKYSRIMLERALCPSNPLEVTMCLAIPAKVIEQYESNGMKMAKVDFGGVVKEACMEYLPEIKLGDYTIVHVGFGLSILDEQEAAET